ncbi:DoxX-like family protein [Roseovarius atlanticus]|uniref:DoxX-like family protein n=1 Tax=Roseovarius atlanticus TaxID=1641875 RepID=UPI001C964EC2|nr:DoxX-like family protein [Roseovarius atlanticus]MBY5986667.1 SDR family oxidoreductase [Roseovarius atlanticus]MBY6125307.1 SDR family oxidoreductase [Roseovarius atlanticus]MBY6150232.1 SDR family oxidoreductase [Roseovarius atlanticus]
MSAAPGTVLVLGADGFIGRHLAFGLRDAGWHVLACARRTARLKRMGFNTLQVDLTDPQAHRPEFWRSRLTGVTHIVNSAGVLDASEALYTAVHVTAPEALYTALPDAQGLLISAVGIDGADTDFARFRHAGEKIASDHDVTILRVGLVLGETSYGGSSLARALAALPVLTPVVGDGQQVFNPIHAADLARAVDHLLRHPPGPGPHDIGGPETVTQAGMLHSLRAWFGLPSTRLLRLPVGLAKAMGRIGDAMRLGPISATSVAQLQNGVLADHARLTETLPEKPRGFSTFLAARPAGTQDLWHARLYLARPALRIVLALLWLASGLLGLFLPRADFLPLIPDTSLPDAALVAMARLGGVLDLALAAALIRGWRPRLVTLLQAGVVLSYTLAFTILAPGLWLLPLGGLLKNLPILALIAIHAILEDER